MSNTATSLQSNPLLSISTDNIKGKIIRDNDTYIVEDNTILNNFTVSKTTLYAGKETGGHAHENEEEVYIFQTGTGRMQVGDNYYDVTPGSMFMIPTNHFHKVWNTGEETMEFIAIFQKYERNS